MRLTVRGDLVALIEAERPTIAPAEAFVMLNRLALKTTGLPMRDLLTRQPPNRSAKAKALLNQLAQRRPSA